MSLEPRRLQFIRNYLLVSPDTVYVRRMRQQLCENCLCRTELGNFKQRSLVLVERKQLLVGLVFFIVVLLECVITTNCTAKNARENPTDCISRICFCIFSTVYIHDST